MTSILKVSEIQDPTNGNTALTVDSSGRAVRSKVPAWFFIVGTGHGATNSLVADPVIFNQKVLDDDGAGGTMSDGNNIKIPKSGVYWISYGGIKGSSASVVGRYNMVKVSGTGDDIFVQCRGEENSSYAQMAGSFVKYLYADAVYKMVTYNDGMWNGGSIAGAGFNDPYWTGYLVG